MSLETRGEMTVGAALPLLGDATTAIGAAVGVQLPGLEAAAAVFGEVSASIAISPPSAAVFAEAALDFQPPSVDANFGIDAGAAFSVEIGQLQAYLAIAAQLASILATAGVYLYVHRGPAGDFVLPANAAGAPNPGTQVFGIVLACQASATSTVAALSAVCGVTT